jgi:FtsH-binding integral membrane protein
MEPLIETQTSVVRDFFNRVYSWMTAGLVLTAVTALFTLHSLALLQWVVGAWWLLALAEVGLVFFLNVRIASMSNAGAGIAFAAFSILQGLLFSGIFLAYSHASIAAAFLSAAGIFLVMSLIGYTTRVDLTRYSTLFVVALIGLLLAMVVNFFLKSGPLEFILSVLGVLLFTALIAYDTQRLKALALMGPSALTSGPRGLYAAAASSDPAGERFAILGALVLYLDFINLFLFLLQIFGGSSRR